MAPNRVSPKKEAKFPLSPIRAERPSTAMKTNALDIPEMEEDVFEDEQFGQGDVELPEQATRPLMAVPVDLAGTVNNLSTQIELLTRTL
jgi:hypothetical protein